MAESPPHVPAPSRSEAKAESRKRDLETLRSGGRSADEINAANGVLARVAPNRIRIVAVRRLASEPGMK
ncbi:hypothetical protein [Prosthecodimorpha staleyi]|uniref:Uncharacterized protein n=1 Tax=Prosthecodimorpha staleyi TaxID=2840188 RepID=A0A947GD15_9HYPH|nr:hypothetical protein [Prosthecodimorpha staleyi]MBT9287825.1 hypothetical protein [Prosthecodimorpha staleyi]